MIILCAHGSLFQCAIVSLDVVSEGLVHKRLVISAPLLREPVS